MAEIEQTYLLCGPICSGKSTALTYIDENYDVSTTEMEAAARHMYYAFEIRSVSITEWWAGKHEKNPPVRFAERIVQQKPEKPRVISGLRSVEELEVYEDYFGECKVVLVTAPFFTRFERNLSRGDESMEIEEFAARDWCNFNLGLKDLIEGEYVDYTVSNHAQQSLFDRAIDELFSSPPDHTGAREYLEERSY